MAARTVALVNDRPLVVAGLRRMIDELSDQLVVVDIELGGVDVDPTDIALFDTAYAKDILDRAVDLRNDRVVKHLVVYTWDPHGAVEYLGEISSDVHIVDKAVGSRKLIQTLESLCDDTALSPIKSPDRVRISSGNRKFALPTDLSNRELAVVARVSSGLTNVEIAEELELSSESVKTYLRRSMQKLGVSSRAQVAAWAGHHGLVSFD